MTTKRLSHAFTFLAVAAITFSLAVPSQAQILTTLFAFSGNTTGENPDSALIFDSAGNLYGTTPVGGKQTRTCKNSLGCGMVYELEPGSSGWTEAIVYTFTGAPDGQQPTGAVIADGAGNLYGVTNQGGNDSKTCWDPNGCGIVYKLSPNANGSWTESIIYTFTGGNDGASPVGPLAIDAAGNLYGATLYGGTHTCGQLGCGVAFELSPSGSSWTETILHDFTGGTDGQNPQAGFAVDASGSLYGSAGGGINTGCTNGCAVVYKLSSGSSGWNETVIHSFSGGRDGGAVNGSLVFDSVGNLYGTTVTGGNPNCVLGGDSNNCGVVFKLTPKSGGAWKETSFALDYWNGAQAAPGVTLDASDNIYAAAISGGDNTCTNYFGCGLIFKLTPNSSGGFSDTIIHRFTGTDGAVPFAKPIFDASGNLYGTAAFLGSGGYGTAYEIKP